MEDRGKREEEGNDQEMNREEAMMRTGRVGIKGGREKGRGMGD